MRKILGPIAAGLVALAGVARGEPPEGDWIGMMKTPTYGDLTMALHLLRAATRGRWMTSPLAIATSR